MLGILQYTLIVVLALFIGLILLGQIRRVYKKHLYRNRQFGETRTWDLGQTGDATLIYQVNPENDREVQVALKLHQSNDCTQTMT